MTTVTSVSLSPLAPMTSDPTKAEITVAYSVLFESAEAGQTYRIAVQLCAEDLPGDDEPSPPVLGPQVLYTFIFGLSLYKSITAAAGTYSETVKAIVPLTKLDEDPGVTKIPLPGQGYFPWRHEDDVYARVTVSRIFEGRSTTQHIRV